MAINKMTNDELVDAIKRAHRVHFPDFTVNLDADYGFELRTFNPDADDDGRAHDYGKTLIEGELIDDGIHGATEMNRARARQIASLLEHAPDLFDSLEAFVDGDSMAPNLRDVYRKQAAGVLADIRNGRLRYDR